MPVIKVRNDTYQRLQRLRDEMNTTFDGVISKMIEVYEAVRSLKLIEEVIEAKKQLKKIKATFEKCMRDDACRAAMEVM